MIDCRCCCCLPLEGTCASFVTSPMHHSSNEKQKRDVEIFSLYSSPQHTCLRDVNITLIALFYSLLIYHHKILGHLKYVGRLFTFLLSVSQLAGFMFLKLKKCEVEKNCHLKLKRCHRKNCLKNIVLVQSVLQGGL